MSCGAHYSLGVSQGSHLAREWFSCGGEGGGGLVWGGSLRPKGLSQGVKMVCLSGLITPSLAEMAHGHRRWKSRVAYAVVCRWRCGIGTPYGGKNRTIVFISGVFIRMMPPRCRWWHAVGLILPHVLRLSGKILPARNHCVKVWPGLYRMLSLPQADSKRPEVRPWEYAAYPHGVSDFYYRIADLRRYI